MNNRSIDEKRIISKRYISSKGADTNVTKQKSVKR